MTLQYYLVDKLCENMLESIQADKRINDVYSDMDAVIKTHYQSLYLHLKALSQYYTIRNDNNKARRLMTLANELTNALDQRQEVIFRK